MASPELGTIIHTGTYLEMDIPQLGVRIPSAQLRRFWTMLAHSHGQLWNGSKIAGSLGLSAPNVRHYLDLLEDTFVVRQVQPYHANLKKRLIKSPRSTCATRDVCTPCCASGASTIFRVIHPLGPPGRGL